MTPLDYRLFDADEHYYEAEDAAMRYLDREHRGAVRWIDLDGRRTLLVNDRLLKLIPNPTYDPVGRPGALASYFAGDNPEGRSLKEILGEPQPIQPEYRNRDARLAAMDAQGVEFTWLLPSLGLGLEEMLHDNVGALHAVMHSLNRTIEDDWGYNRDGRIHTGAVLSFVDPEAAEKELARVLEGGARLIVLRPAPVVGPHGARSVGDPAHDRLWAMAADAGVVVAFHAADSGYGRYAVDWGEGYFQGVKTSPFSEVLSLHIERPIFDTIAAMICHGVFDRHPGLRIACVELGAGWTAELFRRLKIAYGKMPQAFGMDPIEAFLEHVWVTPFHEDDLEVVRDTIGIERMLLGSDWPHPEGVPRPGDWLERVSAFPEDEQRRFMRDNLRQLVLSH